MLLVTYLHINIFFITLFLLLILTCLCYRFFPLFILLVGIFAPLSSGIVSSATIAFVYRASSIQMQPLYAMFWGVGQTLLSAAVGFTRILATL